MAKELQKPSKKPKIPRELKGLLLIVLSFALLLSQLSFTQTTSSSNWLGLIGWGIGFTLSYLFGLSSYLVIAFLGWIGWQQLLNRQECKFLQKSLYFSLFLTSASLLCNLIAAHAPSIAEIAASRIYTESHLFDFPYPHEETRYNLGGVPFYYLYYDLPTLNLQRLLSDFGVALTATITLLVSFFLLTELPFAPLMNFFQHHLVALWRSLTAPRPHPPSIPTQSLKEIEQTLAPLYSPHHTKSSTSPAPTIRTMNAEEIAEPAPLTKSSLTKKQAAIKAQQVANGDCSHYQLPPTALLNPAKKVDQPSLKKDLQQQANILEETLTSFGIEAKVGQINCGPTITSFEVHPAVGVKVQKIKTLENDIALNLQAKSIRIIAPIPGKAAVGVEIPSLYPQEVSFKDLLINYQQASQKKMMIPLLLGKTVSGENVITDLTKMPHCLIAGATGSGKSVCINTIILSILMNTSPDEVKLIMIDPKKVELTPYTQLPHMISPVITEPHGAYAALNWLVKEMQNRYDLLKQLGVRNISAFNHRQINKELEASLSIPVPEKLPYMVAIIDEFADLMMASSSDLETPIARIAQMARAVGIHLLLATQRPSREVITGLIKANFPTRIAFKVANRVNSQIILDDIGAESLLGNGDMLFLPPGTSSLIRAQGAYISDEEIHKIISFINNQMPARYLINSFDAMRIEGEGNSQNCEDSPKDMLYEQAKSLVIETKVASTTFLQRKLKIGYARAASLMDELEANHIIGPQEGAKPRRILSDSIHKLSEGSIHDTQDILE